jgi:hypothetical protein
LGGGDVVSVERELESWWVVEKVFGDGFHVHPLMEVLRRNRDAVLVGGEDERKAGRVLCGLFPTMETGRSAVRHFEGALKELKKTVENQKAGGPPCSCSVWPCPTCGAVDWEDAGNKCQGSWVCSADDQRQLDYEREQSTHARLDRHEGAKETP